MEQNPFDFGDELRETIANAIGSQNFDRLSRNVADILESAFDAGENGIRRIKDSLKQNAQNTRELCPTNKNALPPASASAGLFGGTTGAVVSAILVYGFLSEIVSVYSYILAAVFAAITVLCVKKAIQGSRAKQLRKSFKLLCGALRDTSYISVEEAAAVMRLKPKKAVRELKRLIELRVFPQGHIDPEEKYFIGNDDTYRNYLSSYETMLQRRRAAEDNPRVEEIKKTINSGREHIQKIRAANDIITNEPMSKKLDDTEKILDKIFDRVEEKPELLDDVRRLLDYYLPIVQKLLDAYINLDKRAIEADNITKPKDEIEKSMDSINAAFFNLYNSLFHDERIDIISDINVLNSMFAQEGLSGSDFDKNNRKG